MSKFSPSKVSTSTTEDAETRRHRDAEKKLITNSTQNSKLKTQNLPLTPDSRRLLHNWMHHCRSLTLTLFEGINYDLFSYQAHPDFSPIGWHLGHIAYTESLWLLEHCAGQPCLFPHYRRLFAADGLPKSERVNLPTLEETCKYLSIIREKVFEYLEVAPIEKQERLWRFLLQHESQHAETIALVLELIRNRESGIGERESSEERDAETWGRGDAEKKLITNNQPPTTDSTQNSKLKTQNSPPTPDSRLPTPAEMVCIPAGHFTYGDDSIDALDNERPVHSAYLETYWIDRYPVTCRQFRVFMEAEGYQDSQWWSPEGWQWLQSAKVSRPLYWKEDPAWNDHPVCGVSWYEADAYARFVGKRLPTELEWEKAARWNPVTGQSQTYPWGEMEFAEDGVIADWSLLCNHNHLVGQTTPVNHYPSGKSPSGCYDMLGNVWEWTSSWFNGYDGFEHYPYRGYSQAYFDNQHRVLRGGSWATRSWAMRSTFRNWYHPHVREVLAGFRCAADREVVGGNVGAGS